MKSLALAVILAAATAVAGWVWQDQPYRLRQAGYPADQAALAHRDSAYSNITWVVSPADNFMQLRFFDRVEGGICIRPGWNDIAALAAAGNPRLAHLVPAAGGTAMVPAAPAQASWGNDWTPNPGTLTNTKYVTLYPVGILLNQRLMAAAGNDYRKAKPRILIVGLGSGIGIAVFAHHFPEAEITVVDIDQAVIDMVGDHFPLLRWLTTQQTADHQPRLRLIQGDARQFIRYQGAREAAKRPYDLVVLDAYTAGSTIPPHLMTREFYVQCASLLGDDGMLFANIIGSYNGEKKLVLGGAIRTMRAAGLPQVYNFPILRPGETQSTFMPIYTRNNLVVASRKPLAPSGPNADLAGWERLKAFVPYPELDTGKYRSELVYLGNGVDQAGTMLPWAVTSLLPWEVVAAADPTLRGKLTARASTPGLQHITVMDSNDRAVIERVAHLVAEHYAAKHQPLPVGWDEVATAKTVVYKQVDWVLHARETYLYTLLTARDPAQHSGESLVGPVDGAEREAITHSSLGANWVITEAPLFTDARPNADIYNSY